MQHWQWYADELIDHHTTRRDSPFSNRTPITFSHSFSVHKSLSLWKFYVPKRFIIHYSKSSYPQCIADPLVTIVTRQIHWFRFANMPFNLPLWPYVSSSLYTTR